MAGNKRVRARITAALALVASVGLVPALTQSSAQAAWTWGSGTSITSDPCGVAVPKATGGTWTCSFADDFNGWSLDSTKWVTQDTATTGFHLGSTCYERNRGYAVSGGTLRLNLTKVAPFVCRTPTGSFVANYSGGGVSTWGKFSQTYGRYEARIKFPTSAGPGVHSNFWMNPLKHEYGVWPASGEIDVAEFFSSHADRAFPSLHYAGRTTADTGWNCVVGSADVFHTYTVEWGPSRMDFFYDGKLCFSRTWLPTGLPAPAPFDKPFTAALITGVGQLFNAPSAGMPWRSTTIVDYVRAWR